jgi:hypothetical protein
MRRIIVLASFAGLVLAGVASAACPPRSPSVDKQTLRDLEAAWLTAHDRPTLERILADDFQHPVFTGDVLTKPQHIEWAVAHPLPPGVQIAFTRLEVRLFGDTALVSGALARTDDQGKLLSRNVFTDVFLYRRCRWQAVSAQETEVLTPGNR